MKRFMFVLACLMLCIGRASAQEPHIIARTGSIEYAVYKPNCNPIQQRFDPVWFHGEGWTMPRAGWWVMYPSLGILTARGLHKLGVNRKVAAVASSVAIGVIPHLRQAALGLKHNGRYRMNAPDWAGDAWIRFAPVWDAMAEEHHSKKEYVVWAAGTLTAACFISP